MKSLLRSALIIFTIFCGTSLWCQEEEMPTDDLGNVSDAFQENFFEALKQRGIENYELALTALQKATLAAEKDPEHRAVVKLEMGKNLAKLKRYEEAETKFNEVLQIMGQRLDVLESLYDLYYEMEDHKKAIPLVKQLIEFDDNYKEDLANLYAIDKQYEKALSLIDELDQSFGENEVRNELRRQIYAATGDAEGAISDLEKKIDANPKNEQDYLNLIYLYSRQGETQKAFAAAKELLKNKPNSEVAHLALYKFYIENSEIEQAINSMEIVFASTEIEKESKIRVLGDFIVFASENEGYDDKLEEIVKNFSDQNSGEIYEQIGLYFVTNGQKDKALRYYQIGNAKDPDNFSLLKNTILLLIDSEKSAEAAELSATSLEIFPAQALLYLLNGVAENDLGNFDAAIESLETGIDYLFDDPKMERDFYNQFSIAYTGKGDAKKAETFRVRAAQINIAN